MREHRCGILSWRYAFQLKGVSADQLTIIRQEALLENFQRAFSQIGCELESGKIQKLNELPRANTTKRIANYREYYNESSKQAVERLDRLILEKYDYQF